MCGLAGFSKTTSATRLLTAPLLMAIEMRGHDSWGVTDGDQVHKYLGSISKTFVPHELEAPLYHTRAASCGAVSVRNAHPFKFSTSKKTVVGAHNGCLSNHWALKNKYDRKDTEVDSEHIFLHLAEDKDVGEVDGWGAVIWYEYPTGKPEERVRYFSRFSSEALHFAKLATSDHEIVFASTSEAIENACRYVGVDIEYFYETELLDRYLIKNNELVFVDTLPWEANPVEYKNPTHQSSHYPTHGQQHQTFAGLNSRVSRQGLCASKTCSRSIGKDMFICQECLAKLKKEYVANA